MIQLRADFNGLFNDAGNSRILCLSHSDVCGNETGAEVRLVEGMRALAFESDSSFENEPDTLLASGTVEPAPTWLQCSGSRWVLRIDEHGVSHASEHLHPVTHDD